MKAQRGFASLIMLLIYAGIAAAVLGAMYAAWSGFKDHIGKPYAEAQRQADQVIVDNANREQKAAEADRDEARGNVGRCESSLKSQADAKADFERQANARLAAARDAKAQAQREAAAAAPRIADLQAKAAAAPKLQSCEAELKEATDAMRNSLRERRGIPGAVK